MQSNFCRYHFGLEWEKRKIVGRVHAKRILQTAPHTLLQIFCIKFVFPRYKLQSCIKIFKFFV